MVSATFMWHGRGPQGVDRESDELARLAHRYTPQHYTQMRAYLISNIKQIPGLKKREKSSKSKPSKVENFEQALSRTSLGLFTYDESNDVFLRLVLNLPNMEDVFQKLGGEEVFGSWSHWGDVFALRAEQSDVRARLNATSTSTGVFCRD